MLLNVPDRRRSLTESGSRAPPNTPVSSRRRLSAIKSSVSLIVASAAFLLLLSVVVALSGLIGALPLDFAVYMSVVLVFVAGLLLLGVWRGSLVRLSSRLLVGSSSGHSLLCVAEVEVDAETQLTVRSWWPSSLEISEVRANGTRVALENAERWFAANRGFSVPEVSFDSTQLDQAISHHLCTIGNNSPASSRRSGCAVDERQCAVCFDEISDSDACTLRLCGHCVHRECLSAWFTTSRKVTCPMCRCDHSALLPAEVLSQQKSPGHNLRVLHVRVQRAVLPQDVERGPEQL